MLDLELRTDTERPASPAAPERDRRPDTDLRENCEREDAALLLPDVPPERESEPEPEPERELEPEPAEPELEPEPAEPEPELPRAAAVFPVTPVGAPPIIPSADTTGARPQMPQ
ncbi:hypothetical protein [Streptomyces johnsoniae]